MSNLPIHGFGGGSGGLPVWGFGPSDAQVPFVEPRKGLISGGDAFIIANGSLSTKAYVDTFPGVSLDGSKWSNISSGGGTATVNTGLFLNVPLAGGTAGVRTSATYQNFDVTTTFRYNNTIESLYPNSPITFLRLTARIDNNNNFSIANIWDPLRGASIQVSTTVGGSLLVLRLDPVKSSSRALRLVRYGGRIQAYIGGNLLVDYSGWKDTLVNLEVVSSSTGTPIALQAVVSDYTPSILVTFGDEICPAAQEVVDRVIGATPSTKLPSKVEVRIHSISETSTLGVDSFEYFAPLQLTISNNNASTVISNDNTLRDSTSALKGFRL